MLPQKRWSGTIAIVLITALLALSLGSFGLADWPQTLREIFLDPSQSIERIRLPGPLALDDYRDVSPSDPQELLDYLASLTARQVNLIKHRYFLYPGHEKPHRDRFLRSSGRQIWPKLIRSGDDPFLSGF